MKTQILLIIILGTLFSCSIDDRNPSEIIEIRVNHFQNTRIAVGPVLTLLIQKGDEILKLYSLGPKNKVPGCKYTRYFKKHDAFLFTIQEPVNKTLDYLSAIKILKKDMFKITYPFLHILLFLKTIIN